MSISRTLLSSSFIRTVALCLACIIAVVALFAMPAFAGGTLDPTFGTNGEAAFEGSTFALQPDGKIVAAGSLLNLIPADFVVRRYNADGTPDVFFGNRGRVITAPTPFHDIATAVAIQPDGKIVVGGYSYSFPTPFLILVRYHADGVLDHSFGDRGISLVQLAKVYTLNAVAIQPDGKIVVVGGGSGGSICEGILMVGRFTSAGALERNFGRGSTDESQGVALIRLGSPQGAPCSAYAKLRSVAVLPDGKILVGGSFLEGNGLQGQFVIGQFSKTGKREFLAIYRDGRDDASDESGFGFVKKLPDGKILAVGTKIARFLEGGELDPTFLPNAQLQTTNNQIGAGRGAVLPDGKIVHATRVHPPSSSDTYIRLMSIDGSVLGQITRLNTSEELRGVLAQPDGKVIVITNKARRYLDITD